MITRYKTNAFVYKKNNINEADKIFSVFTDDFGKLNIFAKAIRKITSKLRSGIDIFSLSEIEFIQGKSRKTLTDANIINKFNNRLNSLEKLEIAHKIVEVLDLFIKGEEKDHGLFGLLNESFAKLDDDNLKNEKRILIYYYFLWNALSLLGYRSEVKNCARCSKELFPSHVYFSGRDGGIICKNCLDGKTQSLIFIQKINSDTVKILRIILSKNWQILLKLKIDPVTQKILSDVSENAVNSFSPNYC